MKRNDTRKACARYFSWHDYLEKINIAKLFWFGVSISPKRLNFDVNMALIERNVFLLRLLKHFPSMSEGKLQ